MTWQLTTRDIRGQMIFLGTGTSHGIPVIGCGCAVCTSPDPRNRRMRCGVVLGLPEGNLLIDTPPELRLQLVRERLGLIHAVVYTHVHADHLFGLDDLRIVAHYLGSEIPIHCPSWIEHRIREAFAYAFDCRADRYQLASVPQLGFRPITEEPFSLLGARVTPIPMVHGSHRAWGYRFGNVAYCTDTNHIPPASMALLNGLDVLVLDCLRHRPHPTHFRVEEAVAVARQIGARQTYFTHLCHELEHEEFRVSLPPEMTPAYDGLAVEINLTK